MVNYGNAERGEPDPGITTGHEADWRRRAGVAAGVLACLVCVVGCGPGRGSDHKPRESGVAGSVEFKAPGYNDAKRLADEYNRRLQRGQLISEYGVTDGIHVRVLRGALVNTDPRTGVVTRCDWPIVLSHDITVDNLRTAWVGKQAIDDQGRPIIEPMQVGEFSFIPDAGEGDITQGVGVDASRVSGGTFQLFAYDLTGETPYLGRSPGMVTVNHTHAR